MTMKRNHQVWGERKMIWPGVCYVHLNHHGIQVLIGPTDITKETVLVPLQGQKVVPKPWTAGSRLGKSGNCTKVYSPGLKFTVILNEFSA